MIPVDMESQQEPESQIDFFKWISLFWSKKFWILTAGVLGAVGGLVFCLLATPIYRSEAIISPKAAQSSSSVLSRMGGLGGVVATQIDAGNTPLDRLELIATSRTLALTIVDKNNLLPVLYPDRWDEERQAWKGGKAPNRHSAAMYLRGRFLSVIADKKKNIITLSIDAPSAELSIDLMNFYLMSLNDLIRQSVRMSTDSSRKYLESEMMMVSDPQLQGKIEQLIGQEIEKTSLVSAQAYDLIDPPWKPLGPRWPKRGQIIGIGFFLGLFLAIIGVLVHAKAGDTLAMLRARMASSRAH